jgi:hypothetical protein
MRLAGRNLQIPLNPIIAGAGGRIAQINGGLEIRQELFSAERVARSHCCAEGACSWVSA